MTRLPLCIGLFLLLAQVSTRGEDPPPNIVYIIADDQSWSDFGFMGNDRVYTPNLDALAEKSLQFPNGYLTTSVCRPSLVTLLTGLYPHQHRVHFNHGPPGNSGYNKMTSKKVYEETRAKEFELIREVETLPQILTERLGYRCLQTGKFWEGHHRNGGFSDGMTTFTAPPEGQDFGGVRRLANGERVAHGNGDVGLQIGRETMEPIETFITDCETEKFPWMVWYAPYLPHQPHDSPEQYYDLVESTPGVKDHEIPYYAAIAQFDDTVGELLKIVEERSNLENTIIVFVSDNGWSPSERPEKKRPQEFAHTKTSKRAPFDEGIRSPILVRWDGKVSPETRTDLVSSIDIVPTLLGMTGIPERANELPGKDLRTKPEPDRAVFGAIYPGDASRLRRPDRDVAYRWARKGGYKLIVPRGKNPWGAYLKGPALYHVPSDPGEQRNLISDESLRDEILDLERELDAWWNPADAGAAIAQNLVAVSQAAAAGGLFFAVGAENNIDAVLQAIVRGGRVDDEESPFHGIYFGTPQFDEIDLESAKRYLKITDGLLEYQNPGN